MINLINVAMLFFLLGCVHSQKTKDRVVLLFVPEIANTTMKSFEACVKSKNKSKLFMNQKSIYEIKIIINEKDAIVENFKFKLLNDDLVKEIGEEIKSCTNFAKEKGTEKAIELHKKILEGFWAPDVKTLWQQGAIIKGYLNIEGKVGTVYNLSGDKISDLKMK